MIETEKKRSFSSLRWAARVRLQSRHWKIDRFAFWLATMILTILVVGYYAGYFHESKNFSEQSWVFGGLALALAVLGAAIGYKRPNKKNWWTIADLLWLLISVFTVGKILAPIEGYFNNHDLESARSEVIEAQKELILSSYSATDSACEPNKIRPADCSHWRKIERLVVLPGLSLNDIGDKIAPLLSNPEQENDLKQAAREVFTTVEMLKKAQDKLAAVQAKQHDINFELPYGYLVMLSLLLAFRSGRSGAELARNHEKPSDGQLKK